MHLFLSASEKNNISQWKYSVIDRSIVTQYFTAFWNRAVEYFPPTVSANAISFVGLLCNLFAYHLAENYLEYQRQVISLLIIAMVFIYMTLDAIDGKHARNTKSASPLGELFDHICDNISVVPLVLTMCKILNVHTLTTQWFLVQAIQLLFLKCHLDAFINGVVEFGRWTGPCEALIIYMSVIFDKAFIGFTDTIYELFIHHFGGYLATYLYYCIFVYILISTLLMHHKHNTTMKGLLLCLLTNFITSCLVKYDDMSGRLSVMTVISQGLVASVLSGDMIVAKMAKRELHPLIPIFVMISLFNNIICILTCVCYYVLILNEISMHLRIPIINKQTVIYCSGVFDLLHEGHMEIFRRAAAHGTKLIVGVHTDEDVESYKRRPSMSYDVRTKTVQKCKFVDEVVQAPLYLQGNDGRKFLETHMVDYVVCSDEYDQPNDTYYEYPRQNGMLIVLGRTAGISTSAIRQQVYESVKNELQSNTTPQPQQM